MKIRNGYVSNSSSSSFICEISGRVEAEYDLSIEDAGMYECTNGHTFDEDYVLEFDEKDIIIESLKEKIIRFEDYIRTSDDPDYYLERIKSVKEDIVKLESSEDNDIVDEYHDELSEIRYELPAKYCPICQMEHVTDKDLISYLLKEFNKDRETLQKDIKLKFSDYSEFKKNNQK